MTIVDAMAEWLEENIEYKLPTELWRIIAQTAATHVLKSALALEMKHVKIVHVHHFALRHDIWWHYIEAH